MELTCEKLLFGGFGIMRTKEMGVVFMEGLLPGETGIGELTGKKGGIPFYTVKEVTETSPHRRMVACEYFGECGGCNWLNLDYDQQVAAKKDIYLDLLTRMGHLTDLPELEVITGPEFGYRQRAQFASDNKEKKLGFFKRGSKEVIKINKCPLLAPELNELVAKQDEIFDALPTLKNLKALVADESALTSPVVKGLTRQYGAKKVGDATFQLEGTSFFQSNSFLTEQLAHWCEEELSGDSLLDLFGGVGLFAVAHGKNFKEVTIVEQSKSMAEKALHSLKSNGIANPTTFSTSAERFFNSAKKGSYDTVIVDPPRTGLSKEARKGLSDMAPSTILYIACDPATQARDLEVLVNKKGYSVKRIALFDLYPNTHHMEVGVLLTK